VSANPDFPTAARQRQRRHNTCQRAHQPQLHSINPEGFARRIVSTQRPAPPSPSSVRRTRATPSTSGCSAKLRVRVCCRCYKPGGHGRARHSEAAQISHSNDNVCVRADACGSRDGDRRARPRKQRRRDRGNHQRRQVVSSSVMLDIRPSHAPGCRRSKHACGGEISGIAAGAGGAPSKTAVEVFVVRQSNAQRARGDSAERRSEARGNIAEPRAAVSVEPAATISRSMAAISRPVMHSEQSS